MLKKALAVLLALALSVCPAPLACAGSDDDPWLLYYEDAGPDVFTAIVLAPAKYTRLSDAPRIETVCAAGHADGGVYTPQTERIRFSCNGKTETRWMLTAACAVPAGCVPGYCMMLAVLPGSVLDDAGNGNARVYFGDGTEYRPAGGYAEIDVASGLLLRDYGRSDDTIAVGDTLRVEYSGLYPVEIFLNGEPVADFPGGEMQRFTCSVTKTGPLSVAVRRNGGVIAERSLSVISSKEMYQRNLRDGLITGEDIPDTADLIDVGVPPGSPFILAAKLIAFLNGIRIFFERLFSFSRIEN